MAEIETKRLIICPFSMDDLVVVHRIIFADPAIAWLNGKVATLDETRKWLIARSEEEDPSGQFGKYAVVRREDNALIGLVCLAPYRADFIQLEADSRPLDTDEVELGYALGVDYWGNGYATEAPKAMIQLAFQNLKIPRLMEITSKDNTRSINVMKRLGCHIRKNMHPLWPDEVIGILVNPSFSTTSLNPGKGSQTA